MPYLLSPIRYGNIKSGDLLLAQTNQRFRINSRNSPSISPNDRDEVEDKLPPPN